MLKSFRREFTASLGHDPSPLEQALIENLAWLQLKMCRLNSEFGDGRFSAADFDTLAGATARFARIAAKLGLVGGKQAEQRTGIMRHRIARAFAEIGIEE